MKVYRSSSLHNMDHDECIAVVRSLPFVIIVDMVTFVGRDYCLDFKGKKVKWGEVESGVYIVLAVRLNEITKTPTALLL